MAQSRRATPDRREVIEFMTFCDYSLQQNSPYDLTRPVAEMAAFFGLAAQSGSENLLTVTSEGTACVAVWQGRDGRRIVSQPFAIRQDVRGEWVRALNWRC